MAKEKLSILVLLLGSLFLGSAARAYITSLSAVGRSYPFAGNLEAQIKHESLLWDQREESKIKFGYWQPRASVATSGTVEAGVNFYPISFVELSTAMAMTSRYYKVKKFDCDLQVCDGVASRDKFGAKVILGKEFEFGTFLAVPSYQFVKTRHKDDSKPFADEQEMVVAKNGGDQATITAIMVGLKREDEVFGIMQRYSEMKDAKTSSESQYLLYRFKMNEVTYAVGAGQYKSDLNERGFSAFLNLQWASGDSIGLF